MNELFLKEMPILAAGLRQVHELAPERFDLGAWQLNRYECQMEPDKPITECGFAGCAIGWKDFFIPDSPLKLGELAPSFEGETHWSAICAAYGLDEDQAFYLFGPESYVWVMGTALEVARRIESVINNGFPDEL
jgi:hypothetical protein